MDNRCSAQSFLSFPPLPDSYPISKEDHVKFTAFRSLCKLAIMLEVQTTICLRVRVTPCCYMVSSSWQERTQSKLFFCTHFLLLLQVSKRNSWNGFTTYVCSRCSRVNLVTGLTV